MTVDTFEFPKVKIVFSIGKWYLLLLLMVLEKKYTRKCFSQNLFGQKDYMHFRYIDKCTQKEDLAIQRNAIL